VRALAEDFSVMARYDGGSHARLVQRWLLGINRLTAPAQ
jgi:hypothetical protein